MREIGSIIFVIIVLGMTICVQIYMSKIKSAVPGVFIPVLIFLISLVVLINDLRNIRLGMVESMTSIAAFLYFALYNIPTILFLCIYNYFQRMRLRRKLL